MMFLLESLQRVPLEYVLSWFLEHFIPMLDLLRRCFGTKDDLTYEFVSTEPVVIHDWNKQTGRPWWDADHVEK